jgi:hypothetical protein
MSTENVVDLNTHIDAPLSTPAARVLHDATVSDEVGRCLTRDAVVKAGTVFARATVRKALRANFAGFSATEIIDYCSE